MDDATLCVVGSANVDTTLSLRSLPAPGETTLSTARRTSFGGKGANQAAAAAAAGGQVAFVAAVGDDALGKQVRDNLAERGVDVGAMQVVSGAGTGSATILVAEGGENVIVVDAAANARLDPEFVRGHVSRLEPTVLLAQLEIPLAAVLAAAEAKGRATFVLNPAPMREHGPLLERVLELADVVVPNRTELAQLVGRPVPTTDDQLSACAAALGFDGVLIVTLGRQGAVVFTDRGTTRLAHIDPMPVDAVDTSGAGDAFCGVLAQALARGVSVVEAAAIANEVAARSTTFAGAQVPADIMLGL